MEPSNATPPGPEAEAVYLEYLEQLEASSGLELEAFLAGRSDGVADGVRRLHGAWGWFDRTQRLEGDVPPEPPEPYALEAEIARGGMGVVYGVWDRRLRRRLAMKVSRFVSEDPERVDPPGRLAAARFVEEAQVTAQLDHPGVVPVHEMGVDPSGRPFFTMRRVEGRTLDEAFELARAGREGWSVPRALGVLVQVCETIAFAHARGVVHRDLKPANVMVGRFGETYVMDWGLAKLVEQGEPPEAGEPPGPREQAVQSDRAEREPDSGLSTFDGSVLGTPAYMAPEQAGGASRVDERLDVYSLGAILYHLLAGEAPYRGRPPGASILLAVRTGPPRALGRDASPELAAICERAMAREPGQRYARVEDLRDELRAFLENRVVRAHRTGALAELSKWVARNRGLAAAFAVILALGAAALALQAAANVAIGEARRDAVARLAEARFQGYVANLAAASKALDQGDAGLARRLLDACPEEERQFEWRHLDARSDASQSSVDLGAGLARLAVQESTGRALVVFLDFRLGLLEPDGTLRMLRGAGEERVQVAAWSTSPDVALLGTLGGELLRLDVESGAVLERVAEPGPVQDIELDPAGERVAIGVQNGSVALRDALSLEPIRRFPVDTFWLHRLAWSPDGRLLAASSEPNVVSVWDTRADDPRGALLARIDVSADLGPQHADRAPLCFDARGEELLVGRVDGSISGWRVDDGSLAFVMTGHAGRVVALQRGEEPETLVSASTDLSLAVWDLTTHRLRDRLPGHLGTPGDLSVGPRRGTVTSVARDGTVRVWPAGGRRRLEVLAGHSATVYSVASSPDGRTLASGAGDSTARIWDVARRELVRVIEPSLECHVRAAFGRAAGLVFLSEGGAEEGSLRGVDLQSGATVVDFGEHVTDAVAASPDGRWVAALIPRGAPPAVALFTAEDGHELARVEGAWVGTPCFSPDGERLLVPRSDGTAHVLRTPELVFERALEGHQRALRGSAASCDGRFWATGSIDETIVVWDAASGALVHRLEGHNGPVRGLAFSPDGKRLASCAEDKTIWLWDLERGQYVATLVGHTAHVLDLAFAPDGEWLVSASEDATLRVWDTRPARERLLAGEPGEDR